MRASRSLLVVASLILAAAFAATGWAGAPNPATTTSPTANYPQVGALNYVEGQVSVNGQSVSPKSVGSVDLQKGQSLTTQTGRAEILLTPGVFLRADDNSSVVMLSPSLAPTTVELAKGRAMVEVTYIRKENDIRINENDASTKLLKKGLYDFDADSGEVRVFKGQAAVYVGDRKITLGQKEEVAVNSAKPKSNYFKPAQYQDSFYDWSRLRSQDVLQANAALADQYGDGSYGPDWYWDPGFGAWAFPFDWGWGFYSPFFAYPPAFYGYGAPYYGYRGPYYGRPFYGQPNPGRPLPGRPLPTRPIGPSGGFHGGGVGGIRGGGFGGFHGGGFGGFHGVGFGGFHGGFGGRR